MYGKLIRKEISILKNIVKANYNNLNFHKVEKLKLPFSL